MTRMQENAKLITDYGVKGFLIAAVFWLNSQLSDVKSDIAYCNEKRIEELKQQIPNRVTPEIKQGLPVIGILPQEVKRVWKRC